MDKQELIRQYYDVSGNIKLKRVSDVLNDNLRGTYVILRTIKNSEGVVVGTDIAKKLGISTARIAVALNVLDQKGYIKKERSDHDARKANVSITEKGMEMLDVWEKKICDEIGGVLDKLTNKEAEQLLAILIKLTK